MQTGSTDDLAPPPALDTGLACLAMLGKLFKKPVDYDQLLHQHGDPRAAASETDILRYARAAGLKAGAVDTAWERLPTTPLPCLAHHPDGHWFILGRVGADESGETKAILHDPLVGRPEKLSQAELAERWDGRVILLATRAQLAALGSRFDLTWFIPAVVKYRRLFGEVLAASFFLQLFGLISPLFFQVVVDKVLVHRALTSLDVLVFALIAVSLFEVVLGYLRTYVFAHTTNRIDVELGVRLFRHLMSLPVSYHGARRVGDTVARVRELESIRSFLTGSALTLVIDLAFTVVFFAVMFWYAPLLAWIVVGSLPLYVAVSLVATPVLRRLTEEKFARGAENQALLVEAVSGIETCKALAVEPQMARKWEEQLAAYVQTSFKAGTVNAAAGQGVGTVQKLTSALTLWFGAALVMEGALTIGGLIAFNMLAGRVAQPILRLAQLWQDFQQVRISVERLGDILNAPPEPVSTAKAMPPALKGAASFVDVTFRYRPDGPLVLKGISLEVRAGEVLGIVGPSGSGKSTLTKLVQRMYLPESGRVTIDGIDVGTLDPAWLRRQIGVVLQENWLFNRSIAENIALADPSIPLERIIAAAKMAGADGFIAELPQGYDTVLSERGASLSGGQRQRIAIARALVTEPRVLILDEATSALDVESEHAIQDNMGRICQERTVFIIAHRLSTVRRADRIIVVDKGAIIEEGSHDALLASQGLYWRLWSTQTGEAPQAVAPNAMVTRTADGQIVVRRPVPLRMAETAGA